MLSNNQPTKLNHLFNSSSKDYKVAVLIPAYNCQESLIVTLKSFDKSFPVYIFIVDDGSKMPISINEADFYPHKIEIHHKKANSGIEDTLRLGVEIIHNHGFEFFARIDAGDTCKNNRFKLQYDYMNTNPNIAWLGGSADIVDCNTRQTQFTLHLPQQSLAIKKYFFLRSCYMHPALMFRTKCVIDAGNYAKNYIAAEDMDLLLRIMKKHKSYANLADIIIDYEVNPDGISANKRKIQIQSTLKLQLKYYDAFNIYWYLGVIKNITHFILPAKFIYRIKAYIFGR
ncbi:MAG: hypothetical protein RLZZ210_1797 [Pseudomonadota bacterium]|jgi:glycosyltransferase involved in cell wall biosynthesis